MSKKYDEVPHEHARAFGPGKNASPDRPYMIRLEDAHHSRHVLLFRYLRRQKPGKTIALSGLLICLKGGFLWYKNLRIGLLSSRL
jgi:hypothetical protein